VDRAVIGISGPYVLLKVVVPEMSKDKKWGESFLKSGLPLEHLASVTLKSEGWLCRPAVEVSRLNREKQEAWFELDCEALSPSRKENTGLCFLIECKYHDASRFWFFLPHDRNRWHFNSRVLNCGPLETLAEPRARDLLELAPRSGGGIVVSTDGMKQDNAVYTAVQQLANAYVPYCLERHFGIQLDPTLEGRDESTFEPFALAVIPVIVTNAKIYRLKPEIVDLELISNADSPTDIADELEWTWLYFDPPMTLFEQNLDAIAKHKQRDAEVVYRYPIVVEHMETFAKRPNWIAVVNIRALGPMAQLVSKCFMSLQVLPSSTVLMTRPPKRRTGR
jgi:hypothetical protein